MFEILVVEDNEALRRALVCGLEATGEVHVAGEAATGEQAVERGLRLSPQAVLMDVELRGGRLNGVQAAVALRRELPRLPVVFYSIQDDDQYFRDFLASGILTHYAYVRKSNYLLPAMIVPLLRQVVSGGAVVDPEIEARVEEVRRKDEESPLAVLEPIERQVIALVAQGLTNEQIAARLGLRDARTVSRANGQIYAAWGLAATPVDEKVARTRATLIFNAGRFIVWDETGRPLVRDGKGDWIELEHLSRLAFALSLFIALLLLWLGMTTLLTARPGQAFGRAAGAALLLAAIFFVSHGMIVGKGPTVSGSGMEFWWKLGWLPALSAPLSWYATVIRYAGLTQKQLHLHRRLWLAFAFLAVVILVLLVVDNPFASYRSLLVGTEAGAYSRPLVWLYLTLTFAGFASPVAALAVGRKQDGASIRAQARPWLLGTGLCLLGASAIVAVTASWAVRNAVPLLNQDPQTVERLLAADVGAQLLVAAAVVLLGRAVVAYEIFTERPLPRQGFFRRWRSVVLASAAASGYVTLLLLLELRSLYGMSSLALLSVGAYALFTWQSYNAHERFLARLLPFVSSLEISRRLLRPDAPDEFAQQAQELLRALCQDALETSSAELLIEGSPPRRLRHGPPPVGKCSAVLRLPLTSPAGHAASGLLAIAPRPDGRPYADEEIEVARACGQRLLDAVAGEQIARLLMDLLRQRLGELEVVNQRHKRILHDDVLPDIHLALLRLGEPAEASAALTRAHHTLSELLQSGPRSVLDHLEARGILPALREPVEQEFAGEFASIEWDFTQAPAPVGWMDVGAEVFFHAALEAVRNAARHAAGGDPARKVHLRISARQRDGLELEVQDDGVGLHATAPSSRSGQGLLLHSTLMAVVGGEISLCAGPGGRGTTVRLWLPCTAPTRTYEDPLSD